MAMTNVQNSNLHRGTKSNFLSKKSKMDKKKMKKIKIKRKEIKLVHFKVQMCSFEIGFDQLHICAQHSLLRSKCLKFKNFDAFFCLVFFVRELFLSGQIVGSRQENKLHPLLGIKIRHQQREVSQKKLQF